MIYTVYLKETNQNCVRREETKASHDKKHKKIFVEN
ncbi:MAG: hypothetical protein RIS47_894 [Bacteroidota bacterium]